jgi:4'-phosphopantetheinyl transferase
VGLVEVAAGVHVALAPIPPRATESRAARALLRRLLVAVAGDAVGDTPIASRLSGQPFLPWRRDLAVSLSHSGAWVAAAVGVGVEVGVDVQVPQPVSARLLRRCCRPSARAELARMLPAGRDLEFAWIWSAQEACVKAKGLGLAGLPWTIPIGVGQRAGTWGGVTWLALRDRFPVPVSCAHETVLPGKEPPR